MKESELTSNKIANADIVYKPLAPTNNLDKKTSRALELQRQLQYKLKFNVVDELVSLYYDKDTKSSDKRAILSDLMRYLYPQLKAMEIDQREGEKIQVNITFPDDTKNSVSMNDTPILCLDN